MVLEVERGIGEEIDDDGSYFHLMEFSSFRHCLDECGVRAKRERVHAWWDETRSMVANKRTKDIERVWIEHHHHPHHHHEDDVVLTYYYDEREDIASWKRRDISENGVEVNEETVSFPNFVGWACRHLSRLKKYMTTTKNGYLTFS